MSLTVETLTSRILEQLLRMYGLEGFTKILKPEPTIDERLRKLAKIQEDLGEALQAVSELQESAVTSKKETEALGQEVDRLRQDKATVEELIKVPEEAFSRLMSRASAKGRGRGLLEGISVGLLTGIISSWLVWYFTTAH
jgi:chromosome segregation ATPase